MTNTENLRRMEDGTAPDIVFLSVRMLESRCSPFTTIVWDTDRPVLPEDVRESLENQTLISPEEAAATPNAAQSLHQHAARIAWLVTNNWSEPIEVDVGVPSLGYEPAWPVTDGNHRLAAAIYREDVAIAADCAGETEVIEKYRLMPRRESWVRREARLHD